MIKKFFLSGCFGLFIGMTISIFFNYINNLTVFHIVPRDNSLKTTTLACIIFFTMGVCFYAISFLYTIEKIPFLLQTFIHFCLVYFITTFFFKFFFNLNVPFISILIPYIIIWMAVYFETKAKINSINKKLKNNNNKSNTN